MLQPATVVVGTVPLIGDPVQGYLNDMLEDLRSPAGFKVFVQKLNEFYDIMINPRGWLEKIVCPSSSKPTPPKNQNWRFCSISPCLVVRVLTSLGF